MSKNTIFGEEHFIDTQMIKLVEQRNNAIDNFIFEQMENTIKGTLFVEMPKVEIDKEKLKKWVILCMKLENIEHSELVDVATKKKIADLEAKLAEKDKQCQECKHLNKKIELNIKNKLMTELAEKEKEIEKLKAVVDMIDKYNQYDNNAKELILLNKDNCYSNGHKLIIETTNKDKIDFAVEQLEIVNDKVLQETKRITDKVYLDFEAGFESCYIFMQNQINQLITEIKEGK